MFTFVHASSSRFISSRRAPTGITSKARAGAGEAPDGFATFGGRCGGHRQPRSSLTPASGCRLPTQRAPLSPPFGRTGFSDSCDRRRGAGAHPPGLPDGLAGSVLDRNPIAATSRAVEEAGNRDPKFRGGDSGHRGSPLSRDWPGVDGGPDTPMKIPSARPLNDPPGTKPPVEGSREWNRARSGSMAGPAAIVKDARRVRTWSVTMVTKLAATCASGIPFRARKRICPSGCALRGRLPFRRLPRFPGRLRLRATANEVRTGVPCVTTASLRGMSWRAFPQPNTVRRSSPLLSQSSPPPHPPPHPARPPREPAPATPPRPLRPRR